MTPTDAGDTMPAASTFAIHDRAMAHKPDMEVVLRAEIERLRAELKAAEMNLSDLRDCVAQNEKLAARVKALEEMGRPFAEAYRDMERESSVLNLGDAPVEAFARAAELIP